MGPDELRAWYEALPLGPHQVIGDALAEMHEVDVRLLIDCVLSPVESVIPTRILRDALRQSAITDAIYEAEKLRDRRAVEAALDAPAKHWRVPAHFDGLAADRKALSAEHARMLREESTL